MDNYQCHITLNNRTSERLKLLKTDIPWGVFRDGPVDEILPKNEEKAFVATGSSGVPSGTEGTVIYKLGDDANATVTIYFDIPTRPLTSNTVTAKTSNPDIAAQLEGLKGDGATESCTVKIIDGR